MNSISLTWSHVPDVFDNPDAWERHWQKLFDDIFPEKPSPSGKTRLTERLGSLKEVARAHGMNEQSLYLCAQRQKVGTFG